MPEQKIFAERLKKAREFRAMTQIELGEKANLPSSSIAHFEAGARKPSFDTLRHLSSALDVSTDYLLGRVAEPASDAQGDALYRDMKKLSENDRELAENILKLLAQRSKIE
jgi:transcriptional regulator with XRE-family HTH domain